MENILDRIINMKKVEIARMKDTQEIIQGGSPFSKKSLIKSLSSETKMAIIAEFKRASPSKGVINTAITPVEQAKQYEKYGASAISVLTDHSFFQGSFVDLRNVKEAIQLPVLCKDFIIDPLQIDWAVASGADLILLIVAAMEESKLNELYQYAKKYNLEVLIEVHNLEELEKALKTGAKLIGLNNRNLKTFETSLDVTEQLGPIVKKSGVFLISESGIHVKEDVERVKQAGANGILVGEALMKSKNIKQHLTDYRLQLERVNQI
ncbi:indole-3-glycerol phosphate synthase TrpC [Neobacillus sp. PS3-40]|uniref:indole-3-glycerol phosphate synthase TrpC n=1 Tax=Neobacillus sp. PS3-40 TaxID=3070679 RepID=UPI0027E16982|nr:indole-3-glycerol phosphate synthase TrpC [Neobacillus sp. PS3-40]WML44957.1 indole-3-glycerol phosphate synthase TrpC [Neobacillus sp. PS3-40]